MTSPDQTSRRAFVLTVDGPQRPGLVHALTGFLLDQRGDILELKQFDDLLVGHYFARFQFAIATPAPNVEELYEALQPIADDYQLTVRLRDADARQRVLIMVSRFEHCLEDLLFRTRMRELPIEIAAVVSNHPTHRALSEWHGVPFFHVPITEGTKPQAEERLLELVDRFEIDFVVLARYMQILSDELTCALTGRAINIHHSFLPSFKGARPYHQAYQRGVKTVGSTAHYVNSELDEGPIIAQQVQSVDHSYSPEDLVAAGRDTECKALSNAVRWHAEGRVVLHGNKTVVLR